MPGEHHTDAMASPKLATRSSSLRRSKRMGSMRSLKNVAADGYILGMDQSTEVGLTAQAFALYTTSKLSIN